MKRFWRWTPVILLLVSIGIAIVYSESLKTRVAIGVKAPDFELELFTGGVAQSKQYGGQPVLINFWAAWCPPCLDEMPAHDEFYRRYGHRVEYLAINERETPARIQRHLDEVAALGLTMNLPIALDRRGEVGDAFRLGGMPETWLLDADGVARQHWVGPATFEQLAAGYRSVTGAGPDAEDGGLFHGTDDARAVFMTDPAFSSVFVGGTGGVARYDLGGEPAAGDAFEIVDSRDVHVLLRDGDSGRIAETVTDRGWADLPDAPSNVGADADGRLLAWVPGHGLFRAEGKGSESADAHWQAVPSGLPERMPYADIAAAPFTKGHWVMATAEGLLESRDDGATWRPTGFRERSFAVVFDPVAPRRLYVAAHDGVWVSEDDGRSAERLPTSPQRMLVALDVLPGPDGDTAVAAAAPNGDVYASRDGGRNWRRLIPAQPPA